MDDEKLAMLWDERDVIKVIRRFGRSLDTGDWQSYRSCFTKLVNMDFERLTGHPEVRVDVELMSRFGDLFLSPTRRHHTYTNFDVTVEGERAHAHVYMTARHWKATDNGSSSNTQFGWYDFWLMRIEGEWRIYRFKHDFQWVEGNAGLFDLAEEQLVDVMRQIFTEENVSAARAALAA